MAPYRRRSRIGGGSWGSGSDWRVALAVFVEGGGGGGGGCGGDVSGSGGGGRGDGWCTTTAVLGGSARTMDGGSGCTGGNG